MDYEDPFDKEVHDMLTHRTYAIGILREAWHHKDKSILRGMLAFLTGIIDEKLVSEQDFKRRLGEVLLWEVADQACERLAGFWARKGQKYDVKGHYEFVFSTPSGRVVGAVQSTLDPEIRSFFDINTGKEIHNTSASVKVWVSKITADVKY